MTDLEAFLADLKPSFTLAKSNPINNTQILHTLEPFPYHEFPKSIVFFKTADQRDEFSSKVNGVDIPSREYHYHLGIVSGFPPIAVKFFCDFFEEPSLEKEGAMFEYLGRYFLGHHSDANEIAEWLWSNVPIPPSKVKVKTLDGNEYYISPDL